MGDITTDAWLDWTRHRLTEDGSEITYATEGMSGTFWRVHAGLAGRDEADACAFAGVSSREKAVERMAELQADPDNARYTEWWISRYQTWVFVVREPAAVPITRVCPDCHTALRGQPAGCPNEYHARLNDPKVWAEWQALVKPAKRRTNEDSG